MDRFATVDALVGVPGEMLPQQCRMAVLGYRYMPADLLEFEINALSFRDDLEKDYAYIMARRPRRQVHDIWDIDKFMRKYARRKEIIYIFPAKDAAFGPLFWANPAFDNIRGWFHPVVRRATYVSQQILFDDMVKLIVDGGNVTADDASDDTDYH